MTQLQTRTSLANTGSVALLSAKEVQKGIHVLKVQGKAYIEAVATGLVQCVLHSHVHGNVALAKSLVEALPNGVKTQSATKYLLAFGAIRITDKKEWKLDKKRRNPNIIHDVEAFAEMVNTDWTKFRHNDDEPKKPVKFSRVVGAIDAFLENGCEFDQEDLKTAIEKLKSLVS